MTLLDHFTYGTFESRNSDKTTQKRTGHSYGHLAAVNLSFFCPDCDTKHECWGVLCLSCGTYLWPAPIFRTLDGAAGFIYDIAPLDDWSTPSIEKLKKHFARLLYYVELHGGNPIGLAPIEGIEPQKTFELGMNGYSKNGAN